MPGSGREPMAKVAWRPEFSIGIAAIDVQHRAILGVLNEYFDAPGNVEYANLYARLMAVVDAHFAFEEALMAKHGYPGTAAHRQEHAQMRATLAEYAIGTRSEAQAGKVRGHLFRWITTHVLGEAMDKDLAQFLKSRGVHPVAPRG